MPIKFKCPNPDCRKTLSVKDELAGKKAACPSCKWKLTIPVPPPVSTPAPPASAKDAEVLAAHFLADEPQAAPVEESRTVDFTCPYCDEELHLDAALAGKQAPCPECKRIIKVPHLVKQQKVDWRNTAAGLPSGARRDTEPAPEGAWGSTAKTVVSADALEEAGALPSQRREPMTLGRWILRGTIVASSLGVLVIGVLLVISWLKGKPQEKMLAKAMANIAKMQPGEAGAVINLAAGQYHLHRNEKDSIKTDKGDRGALKQFASARNRLKAAGTPQCDALLIELALAQLDMAGSDAEVQEGKRLSWPDALKEAGQTLVDIHQPQQRIEGLRRLARTLIDKGQSPLARDLARQLGSGPEHLAVVGLEYFRALHANQNEVAGKLLGEIRAGLQPQKGPDGKPLPVPVSVDVVALLVALGDDKAVPAPKKAELKQAVLVGRAAGLAWRGQLPQMQGIIKGASALVQLEALVAAADAGQEGLAKTLAEQAVALAEKTSLAVEDNAKSNGWLLARLVHEGLAAGIAEDRLLGLAQRLKPGDPMRGWVEMPIFRARLAQAEGKAEESLLDLVAKGTLANAQARVEWARHNTLKDAATDKDVDRWDESLRPFGYIGIALGLQERK